MSETYRLTDQPWMTAPATEAVLQALFARGIEARFVGGCVRDAVLGRPVRDIDLATPAPPNAVLEAIEASGLKAVPTGISHGTVTAISRKRPFEITTLRRDVETDGRQAVVAFTDDWREDALRRDFTMNALFATPDGEVTDYFGGVADARAGRVRFVGDPAQRIAEDYLRLLRFFRFEAHYGHGEPDAEGLAAAVAAAPKLIRISAERVRDELLRLLEAPNPVPVLRLMHSHGILSGHLRAIWTLGTLDRLIHLEGGKPDPILRLAAMLRETAEQARHMAEDLRLSNTQKERLVFLAEPPLSIAAGSSPAVLARACYRHGKEHVLDLLQLSAATSGDSEGLATALAFVDGWQEQRFPVAARDLLPLGAAKGPSLGHLMRDLEEWWIAESFRPDREALLERAKTMIAQTG